MSCFSHKAFVILIKGYFRGKYLPSLSFVFNSSDSYNAIIFRSFEKI